MLRLVIKFVVPKNAVLGSTSAGNDDTEWARKLKRMRDKHLLCIRNRLIVLKEEWNISIIA